WMHSAPRRPRVPGASPLMATFSTRCVCATWKRYIFRTRAGRRCPELRDDRALRRCPSSARRGPETLAFFTARTQFLPNAAYARLSRACRGGGRDHADEDVHTASPFKVDVFPRIGVGGRDCREDVLPPRRLDPRPERLHRRVAEHRDEVIILEDLV